MVTSHTPWTILFGSSCSRAEKCSYDEQLDGSKKCWAYHQNHLLMTCPYMLTDDTDHRMRQPCFVSHFNTCGHKCHGCCTAKDSSFYQKQSQYLSILANVVHRGQSVFRSRFSYNVNLEYCDSVPCISSLCNGAASFLGPWACQIQVNQYSCLHREFWWQREAGANNLEFGCHTREWCPAT